MSDERPELEVADNPERRRYEVRLDGRVAGFSAYVPVEGRLIFTHTEVDPELEGQGIGSSLARGALDDVRRRGLRVTARCPFIAAHIRRHDEYADLLEPPEGSRPGPG